MTHASVGDDSSPPMRLAPAMALLAASLPTGRSPVTISELLANGDAQQPDWVKSTLINP